MSSENTNNLYYHAISAIGDGVIIANIQGDVLFLNNAAEELTGWELSEAINRPLEEIFVLIDEKTLQRYIFSVHDAITLDKILQPSDYLVLANRELTRKIYINGKSAPIKDEDDEVLGIVITFSDVTAQKHRESQIRYYSFYDSLTGLYNRAFFEEELKRLDTIRMLPLTIILGDANGLKLVNDAFGHMEGDRLLKQVAKILKDACRKEDIIARVGGDEFVVILPNVDREEAQNIIDRIGGYCFSLGTNPVKTSIALGFATKDNSTQDINEIYRQAEEHMYANKLVESRSVRNEIINSIRESLEERSHETQAHGNRLKGLSLQLGRIIGLNNYELSQLELLAMIHDIGEIAIPNSILAKPGSLGIEEWRTVRKHCEIGYRIAIFSPELVSIADAILSHHEHWDGNGYPQSLSGESIPLLSRIIAITDAFDVLTNGRTYQKAVSGIEALDEIMRCSGTQFDPLLVQNFVSMLKSEQMETLNL